jgi:Asp-tRNA(Asn)/Glu-tRNA(Gln) amidotransferase B subunit
MSEVFGQLHARKLDFAQCPVTPDQLGSVIDLAERGSISGSLHLRHTHITNAIILNFTDSRAALVGKEVLGLMFGGDKRDAMAIVKEKNLFLVDVLFRISI